MWSLGGVGALPVSSSLTHPQALPGCPLSASPGGNPRGVTDPVFKELLAWLG